MRLGKNLNVINSKWLKVALLVMAFILELFIFSNTTYSIQYDNWQWDVGLPTVYSDNLIQELSLSNCRGVIRKIEVNGFVDLNDVCFSSSDIFFGINYSNWMNAVIKFPSDSKAYKVNDICGMNSDCLYISDSDILITKQYQNGARSKSLVVYKNFTKRLIRKINQNNLLVEYDFITENPEYVFYDNKGYAWPIGGINVSNNGKWLALELMDVGVGLLDLENLSMKQITNVPFFYGYGYNPSVEFAVTDDGKYVAVMGQNAGFDMYVVNQDCGDYVDDGQINTRYDHQSICPKISLGNYDSMAGMRMAYSPRFSANNAELMFYAKYYNLNTRFIILRASDYFVSSLDYLALGDSYTSGEGELSDDYYFEGTNDKYEKCHLSSRSYPFLLANLSDVDMAKMKNIACSGAKIEDIYGEGVYWGQNKRLHSENMKLDLDYLNNYQNIARFLFIPGRIRQLEFIETYRPKVVTVSIGGNDVGFADKVKACIGPDTCIWAIDEVKKKQVANEIKGLAEEYIALFKEIHKVSPDSKIIVVGYPRLIEDYEVCRGITGILINTQERQFVYQSLKLLNNTIKFAAEKYGVAYVDVEDSYSGLSLCSESDDLAMNFIRFGDDISVVGSKDFFKIIGQESFHPTPLGHKYVASKIHNTIGDINSYSYCQDNMVVCPKDVALSELSEYWGYSRESDYKIPNLHNLEFTSSEVSDIQDVKIHLDKYTMLPGSTANIEIYSNHIILGDYEVEADGSLDILIDGLSDLNFGYHTFFINGFSYSGEPISYYQVIAYVDQLGPIDDNSMEGLSDKIDSFQDNYLSDSYVMDSSFEFNDVRTSRSIPSVLGVNTNSTTDVEKNNQVALSYGLYVYEDYKLLFAVYVFSLVVVLVLFLLSRVKHQKS